MPNRTRFTGNIVSDNNIFSDIVNDRVGIGTTMPASKLDVIGDSRFTGILTASRLVSSVYGEFTGSGISTVSVGLTAPTGFSVSGSPVTGIGTLSLGFASGYSLPTTAKQTNWDTAYSERLQWDGGTTGLVTTTARTSLGLGGFATANPATPPAIGGTTPAAGSFTNLSASTELQLPSGAPSPASAGDLYRITDTLRYRDSGNAERLLLNATDNLANLSNAATARTNLGLGSAATAATGDFLPTTFTAGTITYAATTDLDMVALAGGYRSISLTGNITFTTSNRASGRTVVIRLICDSTQRTLTFPAGWVFVGTKPANIAASKTAVLSLTFFGAADTDCVAAYGVQS